MMKAGKKKTIFIIYSLLLDSRGIKFVIGGIQQYILGLVKVFNNEFNIIIIQKAEVDFIKEFKNYKVYGFKIEKEKKLGKMLLAKIEDKILPSDYIIWATDRISTRTKHKNTISIQHGITFDFIDYENIRFGSWIKKNIVLSVFYRMLQQSNAVSFFLKTAKVICVDYNFLNWVRTILPRYLTDRADVIPNFSEIPEKEKLIRKDPNNIKILFARRFVEYRGVYILSEIIERISKKHGNVMFGVYGEGPLDKYLKEKFKDQTNVLISSYSHENAKEIQLAYDISLIPTFGSEGTSLSLIESMACGCVPIASNVGGMTNVVVDGYNGFLVNPNANEFCEKIDYLLYNLSEIDRMSSYARTSIENGFSFERWQNKWRKIISVED